MMIARHRQARLLELARTDRLTIHLIVRGRYELTGCGVGAREVGPGDLLVVGRQPLCLRCTGREPGEVVSAHTAQPLRDGAPALIHLTATDARRAGGLDALVRLFSSALAAPSTLRLAHSLLEPLLAYAQHAAEQAPARASDRHVARALAALHERLAERWTVAALAKLAGLSRAAFARRFLAEVGVPPLRHLAALRMRRATELLLETDASLASIAAQIGYESEFAFSRAFKRHRGVAPGAFRRRSIAPTMRAAA